MSREERFAELWNEFLEGELNELGMAELRELLAKDEGLLKLAADSYQTHRLIGLLAADESPQRDKFVQDTLDRLPEEGNQFTDHVMRSIDDTDSAIRTTSDRRSFLRNGWGVAALSIIALVLVWFQSQDHSSPTTTAELPSMVTPAVELNPVRFASLAHAHFFGELSPAVESSPTRGRDYVLMSGLVELAFPRGATAIIEGPAVFRVLTDDCLALDLGQCSVHAPDGAEGFRVETPVTQIVDRGTRFSVNVSEESETDVQVIEGAADVYRQQDEDSQDQSSMFTTRLASNEAQRFAHVGEFSSATIPFQSSSYRRQLPDRIVSYEATIADGSAKDLLSVTVQRGGKVSTITVDQLIASEVTWFKTVDGGGFLCGPKTLPDQRRDLSLDRTLNTGVINPGGSIEPLTTNPVMNALSDSANSTPGLAIRFAKPVVNNPGPDVVFFDLQTFGNPPDGDAFHVSPLKFREGLRSHTIRVYDLTMESPAALELADFHVYMFDDPIGSLAELQSASCAPRAQAINFRGLAVGIDLSDLGYQEGEVIEGLFFQDAQDDKHMVDPVFIAGLPAI